MNFNTFVVRFGLDPNNFKEIPNDPIKTDDGFIYELEEKIRKDKCPFCSSNLIDIKGYYFESIKMTINISIKEVLRIKRVRYKCKNCGKTFTLELTGISKYCTVSNQNKILMINDFHSPITFSDIAKKYDVTKATTLNIFDTTFKYVKRRNMPKILCIDEFHFSSQFDQKYCCVLVDYETKKIVDIIRSRQIEYLRDYFSHINENERSNVKYFISDMYDGYSTIRNSFFPKSLYIIDLFHVIIQLTNAINQIRTITMNHNVFKGSKEYNFMKSNWKYFLCRAEKIPNKFYTYKITGECIHYDKMVHLCCLKNHDLLNGHNILMDLYKYSRTNTYTEACDFIEFIAKRLIESQNDILKKVGETYNKWKPGIASAFAKNQTNLNLSNGIAECLNNKIKTILKISYGYSNFSRFRKRVLLIDQDF